MVHFVPSDRVRVRLEEPILGCCPVRKFLIIWSIVWLVIFSFLILGCLSKENTEMKYYIAYGIGFAYRILMANGSISYHNTKLLICQIMCIIWMVLVAIAFGNLLLVAVAERKINLVEVSDFLITFLILLMEYKLMKLLREHIAERKGTHADPSIV